MKKHAYNTKRRVYSIVAVITAFTIDHLTAHHAAAILSLPDGPVAEWFDAFYVLPFVTAGILIAGKLTKNDTPSS